MQLTRREFAAATAGGLSLFSLAETVRAETVGEVRHAHLELSVGPYAREAVSRFAAQAAQIAGYPEPQSMTALGADADAAAFPAAFALMLRFPGNQVLVLRASQQHTGAPELTLRGQRETREYRYSKHEAVFHRIG